MLAARSISSRGGKESENVEKSMIESTETGKQYAEFA